MKTSINLKTNNSEVNQLIVSIVDLMKSEIVDSLNFAMNSTSTKITTDEKTLGGIFVDQYRTSFKNPDFTKRVQATVQQTRKELNDDVLLKKIKIEKGNTISNEFTSKAIQNSLANAVQGIKTPLRIDLSNAILTKKGKKPSSPTAINKMLKFCIKNVICVDETGSTNVGHDEILIGGVAVNPDGTRVSTTGFLVSNHFDTGETITYNPASVLYNFNLLPNNNTLKIYQFWVLLAEKDGSGFSQFLQRLYDKIGEHLTPIFTALGAAAGAWAGAQVGGTLGSAIAPGIGTIAGIVIGAIFGAIVSWAISALQDDIFNPQLYTVFLDNASSDFNGSLISPIQTASFNGFNGHYKVDAVWELLR